MTTDDQRDELRGLIERRINGSLDDEGLAALERLLLSSADARALYLRHLNLHAALPGATETLRTSSLREQVRRTAGRRPPSAMADDPLDAFDEVLDMKVGAVSSARGDLGDAMILPALSDEVADADPPLAVAPKIEPPVQRVSWLRRHRRFTVASVAASLVVGLVFAWYVQRPIPIPQPTLVSSLGADWGTAARSIRVGRPIPDKPAVLVSGMARLEYGNGVVLIVEGPARFRIESTNSLRLDAGRVSALVPPAARGFYVTTPSARVTDFGTEFGVEAEEGGATAVQVFTGEVEATPMLRETAAASATRPSNKLTAGQAVAVTADAGAVMAIEASPTSFIRADEYTTRLKADDGSAFDTWLTRHYQHLRDPDLLLYYVFTNDAAAPATASVAAGRVKNRSMFGPRLDGLLGGGGPQAVTPATVPGRWGSNLGLRFKGAAADAVHVAAPSGGGASDPLDFSGPASARAFTIAAWVNAAATQIDGAGIVARGAGLNEQYAIDIYGGRFRGFVRIPGETLSRSISSTVRPDGQWHHVLLTFDPARQTLAFYVDGVSAGQLSGLPTQLRPSGDATRVGSRVGPQGGTSLNLDGTIDELQIWRRSLSEQEVQDLFDIGRPR